MKVIIKETYPVVRLAVKRLMNDYYPCLFVDCSDVIQAIDAITEEGQSVDLLIFGMHTDEVEDIKRLLTTFKAHLPQDHLRILVISDMFEPVFAPLAIAAGAKGFVSLQEPAEVIPAAIKAILLGGIFVNRLLARHRVMQQVVNKGELNICDLFSGLEREIAEYLIKDTSLQDIGDQLNLSYTTVTTYRDRILKKVNVSHVSHLSKLIGHGH